MNKLGDFLKSVPDLATLSADDLETLEESLVVEKHADGHVFTKEGERGDTMYLVLEGEVQVSRANPGPGGFSVLRTLKKGDVFGILSLLDDRPRGATCVAVGKVTVASLTRSVYDLLNMTDGPLAAHFRRLVVRQLVHDARALNDLLVRTLEGEDKAHKELSALAGTLGAGAT